MNKQLIEDRAFENAQIHDLINGEVEFVYCVFRQCSFADLSLNQISFGECEFENCDFSNAKLGGASFRECKFTNSKLIGLNFEHCNPFLLSFECYHCDLSYCTFYQLSLKSSQFYDCKLLQVDFTHTNLEGAKMIRCDLKNAQFDSTNLTKTNLSSSYNYSIQPEKNKIRGAKFSYPAVLGLLDEWQIKISK